MSSTPGAADVTVVVPTIGRPSVRLLLERLATELPPPARIVVVDDRRRPAPSLAGLVPTAVADRVDLVAGRGAGPAAARNDGWRRATTPWVVFLDDDVVPAGGWFPQLLADLDLDAGTAASQARVHVPLPRDRRPTDWERNVARLEHARWITADLAVRRHALECVGGFDERFPRAYREDADLSLRLERDGFGLVLGRRRILHPVRPAPWWISVRQQAGNADDVLMTALHGRRWRRSGNGRLRRHVAVTVAGVAAVAAAATGRHRLAAAALGAWTAGTAELAWARIAPGPRDRAEVARMLATSAVLPVAATTARLRGYAQRRRLLADTARAPRPVPAPARNPALPRSLQVEVTAACNLRCPMCLVAYRPPKARSSASVGLERFRRLLEELPGLEDVTLQGLGEPLLTPELVPMVAEAAARGVRVGFNTNGTLLDTATAEALLAAGLDWLVVSLDGATADTYEAIRRGARFDRVVANLRELVALRAGAERPEIGVVLVAMRRNVAEIPALVRLAADLGVDSVSVQSLSHDFGDVAADPAYAAIARYAAEESLTPGPELAALAADARAVAAATGLHLHLPRWDDGAEATPARRAGAPGCDWPWRATYVNQDGSVQPCCMVMGEDRASFGDLSEQRFADVWHGAAATAFRAALTTEDPPAVCRGCSLYHGRF